VVFNSYTANAMSNGISQNPFGPLGSDTSPMLGPPTTVDSTAWSNLLSRLGVPALPGVIALN
jgi:hypothetical protein